jgi:hypothetical protein
MDPNCPPGQNAFDILSPIPPDGADTNRSGAISMNLEGDAAFTDWNRKGDSVYFTYKTVNEGEPARDLYVDRKGFSYTCVDDANNIFAKYTISGSTSLTIDLLGVEVSTNNSTIGLGQTVSASASPINFQSGSVVWSYDTAQWKPQIPIPGCENATACSYAPPRSGRLIACMLDAFSGFISICGPSSEISVRAVFIRVLCPTVQRGSGVSCTATSDPASASLTLTQWKFKTNQFTDSIVENSSVTPWQGKAVVSGTVTATGTVDGIPVSGTSNLTVTNRTWSVATGDTVAYSQEELMQLSDALPDRPTKLEDFGQHVGLVTGQVGPDNAERVATGPNQGVMFLTKVPITAKSALSINRRALTKDSEFYLLQYPKRKQRPGGQPPWCGQPDVLEGPPYVIAHEGLGSPPPLGSHARVFRDELNKRVPPALEPVVALGTNTNALTSRVQSAAQVPIAEAQTLSKDAPYGIVQGSSWPQCQFIFFPSP